MSKATSSNVANRPPQHQVFINFRGDELRLKFVSHLENALKREHINVFIDNDLGMGKDLGILFEEIKKSKIAIAVISSLYTKSSYCLDELATIKDCVEEGALEVFPVFFKVPVETVEKQKGAFGDNFRVLADQDKHKLKRTAWEEALKFVTTKKGETVKRTSVEAVVVDKIVNDVKIMLEEITKGPRENLNDLSKEKLGGEPESSSSSKASPTLFGIETRLKQLKEKLNIKSDEDTRVVGVVGMPGIGKTTLAKKLLDDLGCKFMHSMFLDDVHQKSKSLGYYRLQLDLLCGLKRINYDGKVSLESLKDEFSERKVFIVLDDVSAKSEIEDILGNREWLKKGSRVVIITSCKAVVEGMVDETYLVPGLSDNDALKYFEKHAFSGSCEPSFMKHARKVVDYSRGHPLVLKLLGGELLRKDEAHWKSKLRTLVKSPISNTVQNVLRIPYDNLSQYQKDLFLDVACFFRFEDEYYVRSLLDSKVHANVSETRDLADHFFINICGGRLEMNDLMYTLAMGLESQLSSRRRLLNHGEIITVLRNKAEAEKVRGIFLDMSKVPRMSLGSDTFEEMENLRYLKFFDSNSPKICEADCNLNIPDGLKFTLQEIRYFHWLNFPLKNLPGGFKPENLIDLKLPYSEIEKLWEGEKDTPKLKWLDLNHSSKLSTLSGLSLAQKLQSMNLEGCTELKTVQEELQNMESLEFLNLRGCTSLESLPQMDLISLKTLILSGCSSLKEFNMVSENLEELYLDGTAIKGLPSAIGNLQRLVLLTLKDCKELLSLPDSVGNLKALQKLVLSGCSNLASFPEVKETLEHLKTLLLDGTAITEMPHLLHRFSVIQGQTSTWSQYNMRKWPHGIYGLSSLHRLCLSGNKCRSLPSSISYLYHLKWLDLKYCEQLISLPLLPPNLHCLDAHGCSSLENIEGPMALILAETEHSQSSFVFTNCAKLDQVAKNGIISYVRRKIQLMSDAVTHQEKGPTFDVLIKICFPGWHLPTWFNYRSFRSKLNRKLPRNWNEDGLTGIALCAVVSLKDYRSQNTHLLVTCTSEFKEEDKSLIQFSCILGELTEHGKDKPQIITEPSGHVFVGYISLLDIKQQDRGVGCVATKASFKFEVSDGTEQVTNCEVIKCGFTLICAPTKPVQSFCTEEYDDHSHMTSGLRTDSTGGSNMGIERHYKIGSKPNSVLVVATEMGSETEKKVKSFEANLGDNIHRESMSSGSSEEGEVVNEESPKKEETNQGVDISSGVSSKDTEKSGNGQSLTNGTNNLRELMKKPIRLLWIVISIHVVTALLRGKGNRK